MKSIAPAFIASTARGMSPCPVMTITGSPTPSVRNRQYELDAVHLGHPDVSHDDTARLGGDGEERGRTRVGLNRDAGG